MKKISIIGVLIVSGLGTLFHFMYQWLPIFIFPMNESVFEHLKLILFPFIFYFIGAFYFVPASNKGQFFSSTISAILTAMLVILVCFYTYEGILGFRVDWLNIVIYYISVLVGFYMIYKKKTLFQISNSVIILLMILILFIVFSYYPPKLGVFIP